MALFFIAHTGQPELEMALLDIEASYGSCPSGHSHSAFFALPRGMLSAGGLLGCHSAASLGMPAIDWQKQKLPPRLLQAGQMMAPPLDVRLSTRAFHSCCLYFQRT